MAAIVDALSAYAIDREQIEVLSIGSGNPAFDLGRFAARGGLFRWREIIKGAMFLTTDNAQAQATLLVGPDKIVRLEPQGEAASIALNDWERALNKLPPLAAEDFEKHKKKIERFFLNKVQPRGRFYT